MLYQASLPGPVAVAAIVRARRAVPGLGLAVTTATGFFRGGRFRDARAAVAAEGVVVTDALPDPDEAVHSVVLFVDGLDARAPGRGDPGAARGRGATPSGLPGSVELTAPGVHKGRAWSS